MLMTLEQRDALQYLRFTQNRNHSSVTRARFHAKYVDEYGALIFEDSPYLFCLHLSLFLFAAGLLIYFFNINRATFGAVVWFIATTTVIYTVLTVSPFSDLDILSATPFSPLILRVYLGVLYAMAQIFSWIEPLHGLSIKTKKHHRDLSDRYRAGIVEGNARFLTEAALEPSPKIDAGVLERILLALDEDHALETFFDAVPGFCDSRLVQPLHSRVTTKLQQSLDGFLDRTFSSQLIPESVRNGRLITCLNAAHSAFGSFGASQILGDFFHRHRDDALKSVELGHSLISWSHCIDVWTNPIVRRIVACIIAHAKDRDGRWAKLVKEAFDIPDGVIQGYIGHGESMSLAILNHVTRQALRTGHSERSVLESLSRFDIHNTAAELRHEFCALWNEIVQEARNDGSGSTSTQILAGIRHLFVTLHRGTDAAPNPFSDCVDDLDPILRLPSSYPACNIPAHHPDSAAQGIAIATPHKSKSRRRSEPLIGLSVEQRPRSSPKLRRTQSCSHSPTTPLPIQPNYPPISSPCPALVSPQPLTNSLDVVTKDAMPDVADISSISGTVDPIHASTSSSGPAVQQSEETRTGPSSVVLGSLPIPLPTPALSHNATSAMLPSSIDHAATQSHFLHHPPGAPDSTTTPLSDSLQVTTVSDQHGSPGRARQQDDIQDSRPLTPRVDHGQPPSSGATIF